MLIRKPTEKPAVSKEYERLEMLLATYEKNLRLEVFFIRGREIENLLEILPQQGDLAQAIMGILTGLQLPAEQASILQKRLATADALREANRAEMDRLVESTRAELEEMNAARQRIRQMRHISHTRYQDGGKPQSQLQDWA
jgi:hypothetical protein